MLKIPEITSKNFVILIKDNPEKIELLIKGNIDIPNPDQIITPFFTKLDSEILRCKLKEISIDIKELDFINSSGIKILLKFVMNILRRTRDEQYNINFIYDQKVKSQKTRFNSILFLAPDIVKFIPL